MTTNLYRSGSGWVFDNKITPAGTIRIDISQNPVVSFYYASNGVNVFDRAFNVSDILDANGVPYADFNTFISAVSDFFVKASDQAYWATVAEAMYSYGVIMDESVSAPTPLARVGNMELHKTLPLHQFKNCLKNTDEGVNYYCHPNNTALKEDGVTPAILDGTDGDVVSERQSLYLKMKPLSDLRIDVRVATQAIPGYTLLPKGYLGVYEATIDRTTGQMRSVVNFTDNFRGGNNNAAWDGTAMDLRGKPASNMSLTAFRSAARIGRSDRWSPISYFERWIRTYMFYIEYANLNTQAAVVGVNPVTGFMEGGLGNGVTTANSTEWNTFNGYNPFIPCGVTNSLGNGSGEVSYVATNFGGAGVNRTFTVPRYRGVENPFGHLWELTDGVLVDVKTIADGNTSALYVTHDPKKFSSISFADYEFRGLVARAGGYIRQMIPGEIMPKNTAGGGSTTFYCDSFETNVTTSSLRGVFFGGTAHYGANAGFVDSLSYYSPSYANTYIGSRLCFV